MPRVQGQEGGDAMTSKRRLRRRECGRKRQRGLAAVNTSTIVNQNQPIAEAEAEAEAEASSPKNTSYLSCEIVRQTAPDAPTFEQFISPYPRPEKKLHARKAWDRIPAEERGAVMAGLADWIRCDQWQDKQFIPLPATFLNAKQWNDTPVKFGGNRATAPSKHEERERRTLEAARRVVEGGSDQNARNMLPALPRGTDRR